MREGELIQETDCPRTRTTIVEDLRRLGLKAGMDVIVHSSLSSIGWINGAAVTVIQALMEVITPEGTLIMPTHSGEYSDPARWRNPPVPEEWCVMIRETMPAFEPEITPTRGVGIIPETFRKWPGAVRSNHPSSSFAAWGKNAEVITAQQPLDFPMGEQSPLSHLYDLHGYVLLLGVGFGNNTSFHLAEYRSGRRTVYTEGAPILRDGQRMWATYKDIEFETERFEEMGADFMRLGLTTQGVVGSAEAIFFSQRSAVDFALEWILQRGGA